MSLDTTFSRATREFISQTNKKRLPSFIKTVIIDGKAVSADDVQKHLEILEKENSQRASRRVMRPVFQAMLDYDGVLGTLCQADPTPSALIWGGLKAILECIRRYNNLFEKIEGQLMSLTQQLKRLKDYEELFSQSQDMLDLVVSSYVGIIRFWARVEEQCSTSGLLLVAQSITSFSTKKLDEILEDISQDADDIAKLFPIVQERLRRGEVQDAADERRKAGVQLEQIRKSLQQDREARRKLDARNWIIGPVTLGESNYRLQHQHHQQLLPGTGEWLSRNGHFLNWSNPDKSPNVLWLNGGSGVGKSVLCARTIYNFQKSGATVAFNYFSFDETPQVMLIYRYLAIQLFDQLYFSAEVSDHIIGLIRGNPDVATFQSLISTLVAESQTTFIFLDGLDEEYSEKGRWKSAVDVASFLLGLARQENSPLKLWCSSQDRRKIRELFKGAEEINVGTAENGGDIKKFFNAAIDSQDFAELSTDTKEHVLKSLNESVNGNFLWASMMVDSLESAPTVRKLEEIIENGLPEEFEIYLQNQFQERKYVDNGLLIR
ncbi:uncharacterized protein CTRU02_205108 [Colletotrichum truncatum]|uniref:Uncharacterized protein n=1 Tax=Colletotrichum truncatum TaxID=5467 RepID=A0ACC3Z327_COLTU|nr:uncharacterized protein CTRU02_06062 [Colletotrichum truncatum]KAF6793190.1 hypothetical protein CTRU02_06062 [Colletotrichum truncatum]